MTDINSFNILAGLMGFISICIAIIGYLLKNIWSSYLESNSLQRQNSEEIKKAVNEINIKVIELYNKFNNLEKELTANNNRILELENDFHKYAWVLEILYEKLQNKVKMDMDK